MKKSTAFIVGAFVLGLALVVWGSYGTSQGGNTADPSVAEEVLAVASDDWVKGATSTPELTIFEYSDFQCPACAAYYPIAKSVVEEFGDRVQFVYRHFPLSQIHFNARMAALGAEAAGMQGKFFEMHDMLFDGQRHWSSFSRDEMRAQLRSYATDLGLDLTQFELDLDSDEAKQSVDDDFANGQRVGVNSTPTFFFGTEKIANPRGAAEFRLMVQEALGDITIETEAIDGGEVQIEMAN